MAGESKQSKMADSLNQAYMNLYSDVKDQNFNVGNRFNNYQVPFGYGKMGQQIDSIAAKQRDQALKDATGAKFDATKSTARRYASNGVGEGGALDYAIQAGRDAVDKNYGNAIDGINSKVMSAKLGAMEAENANKFGITQAASNIDLANVRNKMSKYGMMQGALGGRGSMLGYMDNTTWLDDALGVANTAAKVYSAFTGGGGGKG